MKRTVKIIVSILLLIAIAIPGSFLVTANADFDKTPKTLQSSQATYYDLENGIYTDKTVKENTDGTYDVTIDAYTSDVTYISGSTPPVDIMILLDNSASMQTLNSTDDGLKWKIDMAKTAISNVLTDLVDKYHVGEENKIQVSVSMYTFSNTCTDAISLRLENRTLNSNTKKAILQKINDITGNGIGGTNTGEGFTRVKEKITARQAAYPDHKQMLLVLTDGAPALVTAFDASGKSYANTAIACANELKKNGVEIFCIGLNRDFIKDESIRDDGSVDEDLATRYLTDILNKGSHSTKARKTTLFTAILSSAWDAKQTQAFNWNESVFDDNPSWKKVPNYYNRNMSEHCYYQGAIEGQEKMTASINQAILDALSINYTSKSSLLSEYSIKDTVSDYFEIVPNTAKFYKVQYTGGYSTSAIETPGAINCGADKREFGTAEDITDRLSKKVSTNCIEVYANSDNSGLVDAMVVDDLVEIDNEVHSGNKLRITYKIRPKSSFMGGVSVPSHIYEQSGIFKKDDEGKNVLVQNFCGINKRDVESLFSIGLIDATIKATSVNVKVNQLYSINELEAVKPEFTYTDRLDSNKEYTLRYDKGNGQWQVYNSDGTECNYDNSSPDDFVTVVDGSSINTGIDVVKNESYIQFNSSGVDYNKTSNKYSQNNQAMEEYCYLACTELALNENFLTNYNNFNKNGQQDMQVKKVDNITQGISEGVFYNLGYKAAQQFVNHMDVNVYVPYVTVNDVFLSSGSKYPVSSKELEDAFDSYTSMLDETDEADENIIATVGQSINGSLKNIAPPVNVSQYVKLSVEEGSVEEGGKQTIKYTTLSDAETFLNNNEMYDNVPIYAYIKGFAQASTDKGLAIGNKDQFKLVLAYEGVDLPNDQPFRKYSEEFYAVNNCSSCDYAAEFKKYQAQVHIEGDTTIVVNKKGAKENRNDSFVFAVYGYKDKDGELDTSSEKLLSVFTIQGNGSRVLKANNTGCDYFSVVENLSASQSKGWTWNYDKVTVTATKNGEEVAENENTETKSAQNIKVYKVGSNETLTLTFDNNYNQNYLTDASASAWCINHITSDGKIESSNSTDAKVISAE